MPSRSPAPFDPDAVPLGRLRSHAQVQRFRRRQRQLLSDVASIYIVRSGMLTLNTGANPESSTIVELLYPGDVLSTAGIAPLPALAMSASVAAECWKFAPQVLAAEIARDGALANFIVERQYAQRARLQLHVAILAGLTSEERVAALLIEAACRVGAGGGDAILFDLPWSRVEVADYLALNADTLSRIMSRLTHGGIIARLSRSQLTVRKWDELLSLCPLAEAVIALHKSGAHSS